MNSCVRFPDPLCQTDGVRREIHRAAFTSRKTHTHTKLQYGKRFEEGVKLPAEEISESKDNEDCLDIRMKKDMSLMFESMIY